MDALTKEFNRRRVNHQVQSFNEILDLESIDDDSIRTEALVKFRSTDTSHLNRFVRNVQVMKYGLATSKTDMITTCFKVSYDSTSCVYAYLHSRCRPGPKTTTVTHEFVCTGPTYRSQDGEYRHRFIGYDQFVQLFEKYSEIFSSVEQMVVDKLASGKLQFYADFYYPRGCKVETKYMNEFVNNTRIAIKLYTIAWIRDYHIIHLKIPENHMNPAYQYIIYQTEDLPTYNEVSEKLKDTTYENLVKRCELYYQDVNDPEFNVQRLSCGQKIFPLTVLEAIREGDINYSVWREMYITNLLSNLVLNMVCPSFPFIGSWFYIQNSHAGLFDNISMFEKYKHSDIATEVSRQLREVDRYNYYSRDRQSGALSGKFLQLSKNINKAVVYADSDIRLTNLSVCVTSEYVGRTLRDVPNIIAQGLHYHGLDLLFTSEDYFCKHMFEYIYAFYCMNTRLGVIHGDLHMNNVTIYRLYEMVDLNGKPLITDPMIMYILADSKKTGAHEIYSAGSAESVKGAGKYNSKDTSKGVGKKENTSKKESSDKKNRELPSYDTSNETRSYVFPHNGLFSMVIDLSRAVIGDVRRLENEFGAMYAEAYFRDQQNRLLHIINQNFPTVIESSHATIVRLVSDNFPLMFKIISCVDVFTVMSNIKSMFSIDDVFTQGNVKLADGIAARLERLISLSSQLFFENINKAIDGEITSPDEIEWPNFVILRTVFADYNRKVPEGANLVEIFRSNCDMKYDIGDYDNWGPLVSLEPTFKLWREIFGKANEVEDKWKKFLTNFSEVEEMHRIIQPYVKEEKDVLEFEPWMMM